MIIYILAFGFVTSCCALDAAPIVSLSQGNLTGSLAYAVGVQEPVYVYLGIPYAQPPVGDLRFRPSQPHQGWSGLLNASQFGYHCIQDPNSLEQPQIPHKNMSEDCLTINVYTSLLNSSRPVIVNIHGGGFLTGRGGYVDGTAMAAIGDVVVVTFNYRLGALGFLTTGDGAIPANLGLRDQQQALQWIQDNIRYFGGDKDHVTVSGSSAGAYSAHFHLLSPASAPLFKQVISISGAFYTPKATIQEPLRDAELFAQEAGCDEQDIPSTVACLRNASIESLLLAQLTVGMQRITFGPFVDGTSLPDDPVQMFSSGNFKRTPHVSLIASQEGIFFMATIFNHIWNSPNNTLATFRNHVKNNLLSMFYTGDLDSAVDKVVDFYLTNDKQSENSNYLKRRMTDVTGAFLMDTSVIQLNRAYQEFAPSYLGMVSYRPSYSWWPTWVRGCSHSEPLFLMVGVSLIDSGPSGPQYTPDDQTVSRNMINYITNFMRTGVPNATDMLQWPAFTVEGEEYMDFMPVVSVREGFRQYPTTLWWNIMSKLAQNSTKSQPVFNSATNHSSMFAFAGLIYIYCVFRAQRYL